MNIEIETLENLSKRELQVLFFLIKGSPNIKISENLFITESTVKFHCKNIYRKLSVRNKVELLSFLQGGINLSTSAPKINYKTA